MIDRSTFRVVTAAIAVLGIAALSGIVLLAVLEKPIPDILQNLAVGALTGLTALIARPPGSPDDDHPVPVQVMAPPPPPEPEGNPDAVMAAAAATPARRRRRAGS